MSGKISLGVLISSAVFIFSLNINCGAAQVAPEKAKTPTVTDDDLKGYPDYYKKRIIAFRNILRKEKTKEAKIKAAIAILKNDESPYRREALGFIAEVQAKEAVPVLFKVGEYKEYRPDVAWALGEINDERGVEFLLRCLYDENDNVRGNASLSLRKMTKLEFGYNYSDQEESRTRSAKLWENWWMQNKTIFKAREMTEEEKRDAEERWEKYGKAFIENIKQGN